MLRVDLSPRAGASYSRKLTDEYVEHWKAAHPGGQVITRDLASTPLAPLDAEWVAAAYTPEAVRTPQQHQVLELSEALIGELQSADEYVIGVAMHNFSISGVLKLWLDQVVRAGKTFSYAGGRPAGLLKGKKVTFIVSSGGVYEPGTTAAPMDFASPYLHAIFGFMGVTEAQIVRAGGTGSVKNEADREAVLRGARAVIHGQRQAA